MANVNKKKSLKKIHFQKAATAMWDIENNKFISKCDQQTNPHRWEAVFFELEAIQAIYFRQKKHLESVQGELNPSKLNPQVL